MKTDHITSSQYRVEVVHPLDVPKEHREQKCDVSKLGPMAMTPAVKFSLMALRAYLIAMILLLVYKVVAMALLHKT